MTVVFSLLASLLVALFVIPMLASRQMGEGQSESFGKSLLKPTIGSNLALLRAAIAGSRSLKQKAAAGALGWSKIFALELWSLLYKTLLSLAALVAAALKAAMLILTALPLWVMAFVFRRGADFIGSFAGDSTLFGRGIFRNLSPEILSFQAPGDALASKEYLHGALKRGGMTVRILKWAFFFIPASLYYILRLVISILLEAISNLLLSAVLFALQALIGLLSLLGLILLPFIAPFLGAFNFIYTRIADFYPRSVGWALDNRMSVAICSLSMLIFCVFGLLPRLGSELIPEVHQGEFEVQVRLPVGTPLARTDQYLKAIEQKIAADPEVTDISSVVGVEKSTNPASDEGENTGRLRVKVAGEGNMLQVEERVIGRIRSQLAEVPDLRTKVMRPVLFSFKTPIEVEIHGYDLAALRNLSDRATERLAEIPGLTDVRSNIQPGNPEVKISYNRDLLARNDLDINKVAELIRGKVYGVVPTRYSNRERRIDIRVRVREEDKSDVRSLGRLVVNPGNAVALPLAAVASMTVDEGPNEIRRIDQQRSALLTANVTGRDLGSASQAIAGQMNALDLPSDFTWTITGQSQEMEVASHSLLLALLLAVFLVYVVMASQFESLMHPLVIIFSIPMALIGVILALWLSGTTISVMVFIGLIVLAGIVVNNAIVLVDYVNHLRRNAGLGKREAIIRAGETRLRPILMTTATTVLGLLPMALGLGEGAEVRTPMALTVIAGLTSSTLLTLLVIPVVYDLLDWREGK